MTSKTNQAFFGHTNKVIPKKYTFFCLIEKSNYVELHRRRENILTGEGNMEEDCGRCRTRPMHRIGDKKGGRGFTSSSSLLHPLCRPLLRHLIRCRLRPLLCGGGVGADGAAAGGCGVGVFCWSHAPAPGRPFPHGRLPSSSSASGCELYGLEPWDAHKGTGRTY